MWRRVLVSWGAGVEGGWCVLEWGVARATMVLRRIQLPQSVRTKQKRRRSLEKLPIIRWQIRQSINNCYYLKTTTITRNNITITSLKIKPKSIKTNNFSWYEKRKYLVLKSNYFWDMFCVYAVLCNRRDGFGVVCEVANHVRRPPYRNFNVQVPRNRRHISIQYADK